MLTSNIRSILLFSTTLGILATACNPGGQADPNSGVVGTDPYVEPVNELIYNDHVYKKSIHTPMCYKTGFPLNPPVIALLSDESVTISFDDFDANVKDLYYSIIHCDADWNPSGMMEQEFLDGFFTYNVTNYKYSFNTYQNYLHYSLQIPNEKTKIRKSGNYLVKIFANNDQNQLVLTRRFMVYENGVNIQHQYKRPQDPEYRSSKQEIDLTINFGALNVPNPFSDLKVVIQQNNRWDNVVKNIKPMFVKDKELVFDLDEPNIFNGGNEFRFFDLKSLGYNSPNVARVIKDTIPYHILLLNDERRPYKKYMTSFDINGKFLVGNVLSNEPETESDYVWVHFYLPYDQPLDSGNIYLFGALSDWQTKDEFQMKYNYRSNRYEQTVFLKQAYYNYEYVFLSDKSKTVDETLVEGNHFETENNYTILVYFRDMRQNCDRLVGVQFINSNKG